MKKKIIILIIYLSGCCCSYEFYKYNIMHNVINAKWTQIDRIMGIIVGSTSWIGVAANAVVYYTIIYNPFNEPAEW